MQPLIKHHKLPTIYLTILISIMHLCNVLALKIITIFGIDMAMSGFLFPISFYFLTALNESYGHKETEKAILMVIISQSILLLVLPIAVRIPSPSHVSTTDLYFNLYHGLWKVFISSNLAVSFAYYFSSFFNSHFKVWLLGRHQITRFLLSNGVAKAILVLISYPINFYGMITFSHIMKICLNTWCFKMIMAAIISIFIFPLLRINRKIDKVDMYDFNTTYNPLKLYELKHSAENMYEKELA